MPENPENQLNNDELSELTDALISGTINEDEFNKLKKRLRKEAEARRAYLLAIEVEHGLRCIAKNSTQEPEVFPNVGGSPIVKGVFFSNPWFSAITIALLGTGLIGFCLVAYFASPAIFNGSSADDPMRAAADFGTNGIREVISIAQAESEDTEWFVEATGKAMDSGLRSGDVLRVIEGRLTLQYVNGVTVNFNAPVACELVSPMEIKMLLGSLTAEVPEDCKGFSVEAPRATVVDLGTKFRVDVNSQGGTDVVVYRGEVDVDYRAKPETSAQRLRMGEAVRLDAFGTVSRIDSIKNNEFVDPGSTPRSVLFEEVRDNYDRNSSLNYYEIVQSGMREDALAFVDRVAHEWNGIDESGMPEYLLGGDYVRTFNNDKFDENIRLTLKITEACNLYILFDNRLPVTDWLTKNFEDTGDDIGLDNGPFFSNGETHNKGPSGVGPGESIDDVFSIWVRKIEEPGVVTLGATEAPISKPNMYGIVAVPLD